MSSTLPPVLRSVSVACTPDEAFRAFTDDIGAWWPLSTHSAFLEDSSGLRFEDGRLIESASDGRSDTWGHVQVWKPPSQLAFSWHPAAPEGVETTVTVTFIAIESGTRVELEHDGWERLGEMAEEKRTAYDSQAGWRTVLGVFGQHLNARTPAASSD